MKLSVAFGALGALLLCAAVATSGPAVDPVDPVHSAAPVRRAEPPSPYEQIIPAPASTAPGGPGYPLGPGTVIRTTAGSAEVRAIGEQLAAAWRPGARLPLPVRATDAGAGTDGIRLRLDPYAGSFGEEGYRLQSDEDGVLVTAHRPAGLFRGTQTLRQLLSPGGAPWTVAGGTVTDTPRFAHRVATVEVVSRSVTVARVKRHVDRLALYKINVLRLHLADGLWTEDEYGDLARHARARHMAVRRDRARPAPLRARTLATAGAWDSMAFPRVLDIAELGWSPAAALDRDAHRRRLAAHGARLRTPCPPALPGCP
ncbi:glycoside hydrolase family 20 zincin-like fold domain-containing protein [Streptomyces sp. NPDC059989]|uniref:glycoside hydrolase family 20 zincin-like fold domain-containing protein n=1 Tax=Streptomyces sp. NPDC059989 TaxID=3347026 RepID=UPI00367608D1